MATLESLQFEMERRVILFKPTTTMPDLSQLGYNADPNLIITPSTPGEELLYYSPISTRFSQLDASSNVEQEWFKSAMQNIWMPLGSGGDASLGDIYTSIDASIIRIDASIGSIYGILASLDASIIRIDGSLGLIYATLASLDASIIRIDGSLNSFYSYVDGSLNAKLDIAGGTMTGDLIVPGISVTNEVSIGGGLTVIGDVQIGGDLIVDGSVTYVNSTTLDISTNFIRLNTGLTGTPPAWLQSGIVVERGSEDPYIFTFDETDHTFRIGLVNPIDASGVYPDSSTQAVATREDAPINNAIAIWNDVAKRFDTSTGLLFSSDGLYIDGSVRITSLSGVGFRQLVVGPDGTIDTSIVSYEGIYLKEASIGSTLKWVDGLLEVDTSSLILGFKNIGSGDASIYFGIDASEYSFREIKAASSKILIDVSNNLILLDVSIAEIPSGAGIGGGVWITNIAPQTTGNVGDKTFSSDGVVLDSCLTDTSSLIVTVLALPGHTNYKPNVYIDSSLVTLTADPDSPLFIGSKSILFNFLDSSITVVHEDGASWSTIVEADSPPSIVSANFTGNYPGSQTELKAGDTYQINIVTDVSIDQVTIDNYGAFVAGTFTVSGNNVTITGTIADRGTTAQALGFSLHVRKPTGSISTTYISTSHGTTPGVDVVTLNNLYPTATWGAITYPGAQAAIKLGDTATVANTLANYDTVLYSSPNSELGIASPTTPANPLTVSYSSGSYNIATNNLRISANRAANNATTTNNTVVWIANTPVTLSVSNPATRLRSGGNDGTVAQDHTISITASQRLLSAPSLTKDTGGTWQGAAFTWSAAATTFTRALQVVDSETKGTYNWGAISGTNLAGIVTTTNSGTTNYILGGFVVRTVTLPFFGWQANINVEVADYSKLSSSGSGQVLSWVVLQNTRSTLGDVTRPKASTWSASATGTNPTTISILDQSATDSQSQATTFTIQEAI